VLEGIEDVEGSAVSSPGVEQFIDEAIVHQPRQQMSSFSLQYPIALYNPGQAMLMDHCKLTGSITCVRYSCVEH
jgi:hypothetical protein